MAAYLIYDAVVTDPQKYEHYKSLAPAAIAAYGGKYVVRGGKHESVEGDWKPNRMVMLEFPTYEKAQEFWNSSEYTSARKSREGAAVAKAVIVQGLEA
jgi:uncharacterized protein (DUF1330 family)